jgi:hypothetical protein
MGPGEASLSEPWGEHVVLPFGGVTRRGSDGRRRSADAELWRPCESDVARGNRGGVGSLALPPCNSWLLGLLALIRQTRLT